MGEHRATRLAYSRETLEIRCRKPEHEKAKVVIGDLLKILYAGVTELERILTFVNAKLIASRDSQ